MPPKVAEEAPAGVVEAAEIVPVDKPAKPEPEITTIPREPAAPKIEGPRKRRRPPAAKPRRKDGAGRKRRTRKKAES